MKVNAETRRMIDNYTTYTCAHTHLYTLKKGMEREERKREY